MRVDGHDLLSLDEGWEAATSGPDAHTEPSAIDDLQWMPARVPGTAAAVLEDAGVWRPGEPIELDAQDWWFRTGFEADSAEPGEEVVLRFGGIATVAEVFLNGERVLESDSMFEEHEVDVGSLLRGGNELAIRCRALAPLLRVRRKPRARWRTQLVNDGNLRFFRTALLGRAPGFAPGPAAVGPWRPISIERRRGLVVERLRVRARLEGDDGVLAIEAHVRGVGGAAPERIAVELEGPSGPHWGELKLDGGAATGELRVPAVERWWPHTHGEPALHRVRLVAHDRDGSRAIDAGTVGFRSLAPGPSAEHDPLDDGLDLHVNGVRVFARGAVWTPAEPVGLAPGREALRAALEAARDAGMNMLRIPGTSSYESQDFHDLCDELGLLVWQDFMFANLDYPIADAGFRATVEREARQVLQGIAGRPSLAVLCGNSEVEQQVAMMGLDPAVGRGELFGNLLPDAASEAGADAAYVPSSPCGGELPFRPDRGVANYYGVGGYRRPLEDARRADVCFAGECLAFANVPDERGVEALMPESPGAIVVHHPRWKAGVPRDVGTGWDFDDVRDHYLELLFGVDPSELRSYDHERYLELSRAASGEAMAEVFGEWRRAGSRCGGGLVLWLRDLAPGAGWGVIDHSGSPKAAYHHLRRALAPVAAWTTDEGLGGVAAHVANDRSEPLRARLRVALYHDLERPIEEAAESLELPPHGGASRDVEALLGHFADASWSYRFGPPQHDAIVVSLEAEGDAALLSQSFRFPAGRPLAQESPDRLGLEARATRGDDGGAELVVHTRRLAYGVRLHLPGWSASDDSFSVEPGGERVVHLSPAEPDATLTGAALTALNLRGRVRVASG